MVSLEGCNYIAILGVMCVGNCGCVDPDNKNGDECCIQIFNESEKGIKRIVNVYVSKESMKREGVKESEIRIFMLKLYDEIGVVAAKATVEMITGHSSGQEIQDDIPRWVWSIFKYGIDMELIQEGGETQKVRERKIVKINKR